MRAAVDTGGYLGAVTLVTRHGETVDFGAWGHRDLARSEPMKRDTIFRIYSMTKPVVTVAVLTLVEDGKAALDDPVGRHLGEFAGRPVTVRHLLTHTSGLAPASEAMERSADLRAYAEAAARIPAAREPGARFEYNSVNTELAGRLVEVLAGESLGAYLERRIFAPLGMRDTAFTVPEPQRARIAAMTTTDPEGRLAARAAIDARFPGDRLRRYESAAGGLHSTAADYARFAHMLLRDGELDGVRILGARTVEAMMTSQVTSQYNEGFGLGGFVSLDDPKRERPGSVGSFGWSGAGGTYFMVDRRQGVVAILLTQHEPQGHARDPRKLSFDFYRHAYAAAGAEARPR